MSSIVSFSADENFLKDLNSLIHKSGYKNRSRFLRDAAIHFSEIKQRGELMNIADDIIIEGHIITHYEHKDDQKLMVSRTGNVEVAAYHHSSRLGHSCHLSVDVIHIKGRASDVREIYKKLQNTPNVDKVSFIIAPMKDESCC
tara:strand:- start:2209 stop:2637 length:429 start_codon:yes stop_codon:yes gene_type:complete